MFRWRLQGGQNLINAMCRIATLWPSHQFKRNIRDKNSLLLGGSVEIHLFAYSGGLLGGTGWRSGVYAQRNARWFWTAGFHGSAYPTNLAQKGEFLRNRPLLRLNLQTRFLFINPRMVGLTGCKSRKGQAASRCCAASTLLVTCFVCFAHRKHVNAA